MLARSQSRPVNTLRMQVLCSFYCSFVIVFMSFHCCMGNVALHLSRTYFIDLCNYVRARMNNTEGKAICKHS